MSLRKLVFARYGHFLPIHFLGREAEKTVKAYRNQDYNMRRNGELDLLSRLHRAGLFPDDPVLFDVGANQGDWTLAARKLVPGARIYCFEMVPETAEALRKRVGDDPAVTIVECALADRQGEMTANIPANPRLASLIDGPSDAISGASVQVTTGDAWMTEHGVSRIDFLKIDVEGWSLQVLRGFEKALGAGCVSAIQFEYNQSNIRTRTFLRDIYDYLESHQFMTGKIYPTHVEFAPWSSQLEDFRGPNFLAVPSSAAVTFQCKRRPRPT